MELLKKRLHLVAAGKEKKSIEKSVLRAKSFIEILQRAYRNCELLTCYQVPAFGHPDTL